MGYTTTFHGSFDLDKPLTAAQALFLSQFAGTRRMQRDESLTEKRPDPVRKAVGLPVGEEGGYFVGEGGFAGQDHGVGVVNSNRPPSGQPGLWCQWVPLPSKDMEDNEVYLSIGWDGGEKFYYYVEWLDYLIEHFLAPWGLVLNGEVSWQGEERSDIGKIVVTNNKTSVLRGRVRWESA